MWQELHRRLPNESLIYLGDGKNCPYGGRPREEIVRFAEDAVERLVTMGAKMVVVGCNTATTAAIDHLRDKWADMPIVGLEPAVKPACLTTQTGRIAVLATAHSLQSEMFLRTAANYAEGVEVLKVVGEDFVEIVEAGEEYTQRAQIAVRKVIEPLLDKGVDRVVLGCTHYPFLRSEIERVIGGRDIQVIDSGEAVARRVEWLLERYDIAASRDNTPTFEFVTFGDDEYLQRLRRRGERIGGLR